MKMRCSIFVCALLVASLISAGEEQPFAQQQQQQSPRFEAVNILIDPHGKPLAAYQFELTAEQGDVTLVGIQGGDHPAYSQAPYYDPHALVANRIIIAAFNTGADLPTKKTRVATLMVRVAGAIEPKYNTRLQIAASGDAKAIDADLSIEGANP
jgi:hypothetical protein